jgi:hypothetical protein
MLGTDDIAGVGAFMLLWSPAPGAKDEAVAMLDTELLLVGLPGRAGTNELGEAGKPADGCLCIGGAVAVAVADMLPVVGVGVGVELFDAWPPVVLIAAGVCCGRLWTANGPMYFSPSSPGANVMDEQKPSEDVISSIEPSLDLFICQSSHKTKLCPITYQVISVNVAKCRLLTIHSGFCCCVS